MQIGNGTFLKGDCLELMKEIPDGSIDMILCDLPYGTTECKWDTIIPFDTLWEQYWRIAKPNSPIVLTASQPFTSALVMSQIDFYKTSWIWNKSQSGSFANAKYHPLKITEDILVFGRKRINYYPQMRTGKMRPKGGSKKTSEIQVRLKENVNFNDQYFPTNVLEIPSERNNRIHPTQKPVALFEYLINTYTNEGETVLDNTAGSGTTAIAAINTNRKWICMERDETYYEKAVERVKNHTPTIDDNPDSLFEF